MQDLSQRGSPNAYVSRARSAEQSAPKMREYLTRVKAVAEVVKAAGMPQLECVFEGELEALRGLGDVVGIRECYSRLKVCLCSGFGV